MAATAGRDEETLSTPVEDASLGLHVKGSLCSTWEAFPVAKPNAYISLGPSLPLPPRPPLWLLTSLFFSLLSNILFFFVLLREKKKPSREEEGKKRGKRNRDKKITI